MILTGYDGRQRTLATKTTEIRVSFHGSAKTTLQIYANYYLVKLSKLFEIKFQLNVDKKQTTLY